MTTTNFEGLHAYWRAANYLTVGQIYLQDNPLLRGPLKPEHIKPHRRESHCRRMGGLIASHARHEAP